MTTLQRSVVAALFGLSTTACTLDDEDELGEDESELAACTTLFLGNLEELPLGQVTGHTDKWNLSTDGGGVEIVRFARRGLRGMKSTLDRRTSTNYRAELSDHLHPQPWFTTLWYGFSVYLPTDKYPTSSVWEIVAQWHHVAEASDFDASTRGNPPLALHVVNGHWKLSVKGDDDVPTTQAYDFSRGIDLGPYATGRWNDWVFRVRWDYRSSKTGLLQVWRNGTRVVDMPQVQIGYNDPKSPASGFKWGQYMNRNATDPAHGSNHFNYHDEYRVASGGCAYSSFF